MTLGETETLVAASIFGGVLAFTAVLTGLGMLVQRAGRQREARRAGARDEAKAQEQLGWLQGRPLMAPHVVYRSEAEYDADLQRMTLMGYVPIEVYRTPATDGFSFDVRYQLLDREQFNRAALTARGQAGALEEYELT